jgi:purine nucleosidase
VTRRFLIDTDTASDDAVALVMALRHPDVEVVAITVVAGNVPLDQAVQNALYTAELCERADVPVHAGAGAPLVLPLVTAQEVHGGDGMGDIGLALHGRRPAPGHAVDALLRAADTFAGDLTVVTLGPLTNLALALRRDPSLATKVSRCVAMMGVSDGVGNVTPAAEYNAYADPHALRVVLEAGLPLTLVGWDISRHHAVFDPEDARRLRAAGTPLADFCVDIQHTLDAYALSETKLAGFDLPDPIAMAVALDPAVATEVRALHVAVECGSPLTRGATVMDHLGLTDSPPNADVVLAADRARFLALLHAAVA